MRTIAVITLNGYSNYGNRLQNYAVQEVLKSLGFVAETVLNNTTFSHNISKVNRLMEKVKRSGVLISKEILWKAHLRLEYYLNKTQIDILNAERVEAFQEFTIRRILEVDHGLSEGNIPHGWADRYDYFVTGSDQVWNPNYICGSSINFLTFAPKEKRIAYSASFGISEIPEDYVERYKEWLSGMHRISVREETGAKIVKDLTGRDAVVLVDPTMMLSKEKWLSIAKPAVSKPEGKFLLMYFLGRISKENKARINEIAKKNDLEIISLADIKDAERYKADPAEFIDYINSASLICTDSFHGVIFSILMETPFIVFERYDIVGNRPSMYSRIDTLLSTFKLEARKAENLIDYVDCARVLLDVDYSHVSPILEAERKKAIDYLKEALNVRDGSIKQ